LLGFCKKEISFKLGYSLLPGEPPARSLTPFSVNGMKFGKNMAWGWDQGRAAFGKMQREDDVYRKEQGENFKISGTSYLIVDN
jgi:hypothetical protein